MAQLTYAQFAALVLAGLGAPITKNNIDKLSAIFSQENTPATFNPAAWSIHAPGDSDFNGIVRNYPNLGTGVLTTVKGMSQNRPDVNAQRLNLLQNGPFDQFIAATNQFYGSWGGGTINVTQATADKNATSRLVPGQTSQPEIEGVSKALSPDPKVVEALSSIIPGVHPTGTGNDWLDAIMYGTGGPNATIPAGTNVGSAIGVQAGLPGGSVGGIAGALGATSPLDFFKSIWSAATNVDNWKRIGLVVGALLLAIFGLYIVSRSLGGPSATDTVKEVAPVVA